MLEIIKKKKSLRDKLLSLGNSISESRVLTPRDVLEFVFLCGANIDNTTISARRSALIKFAKTNLSHTQFFLAENMLSTLQVEGHKGNLLDIENDISMFADKIIIVLESASSFTELGVFSHGNLRKKLIVINDSKFRGSKSFINLGPIKAIEEVSGKDYIIDYKMSEDGVDRLDSIGDIYAPLSEILKKPLRVKSSAVGLDECNPSINFSKKSAMMVHDLVYFSGPISHIELVEVLKLIFGDCSFKVTEHVAILRAFNSLTRNKEGLYKSSLGKPYYHYKFDIHSLISVFRNHMLKRYPERLYGH